MLKAVSTGRADDPAVPVPLPQGRLGAAVAVGACALDAAVHAWDIAVATGQPSPLDAALAAQLHEVAREIVEPLRGFAYASALPALPGDDGEPGSLQRYLGRDPHWAPRSGPPAAGPAWDRRHPRLPGADPPTGV